MNALQFLQAVCVVAGAILIVTILLRFIFLFILRALLRSGRSWILRPFFKFIYAFCALIAGFGIPLTLLGATVSLADWAGGHGSLLAAVGQILAIVAMNALFIGVFQLAINSALNGCLYDMHNREMLIEDSALAGWLVRQVRTWSWLHRMHDGFRAVAHDVVVKQICGSGLRIDEIVV